MILRSIRCCSTPRSYRRRTWPTARWPAITLERHRRTPRRSRFRRNKEPAMGPPYHTVSGNNITIYLDIVDDSDGTLGNAIDNILSQLAMQWPAIATASDGKRPRLNARPLCEPRL